MHALKTQPRSFPPNLQPPAPDMSPSHAHHSLTLRACHRLSHTLTDEKCFHPRPHPRTARHTPRPDAQIRCNTCLTGAPPSFFFPQRLFVPFFFGGAGTSLPPQSSPSSLVTWGTHFVSWSPSSGRVPPGGEETREQEGSKRTTIGWPYFLSPGKCWLCFKIIKKVAKTGLVAQGAQAQKKKKKRRLTHTTSMSGWDRHESTWFLFQLQFEVQFVHCTEYIPSNVRRSSFCNV